MMLLFFLTYRILDILVGSANLLSLRNNLNAEQVGLRVQAELGVTEGDSYRSKECSLLLC